MLCLKIFQVNSLYTADVDLCGAAQILKKCDKLTKGHEGSDYLQVSHITHPD